MKKTLADLAEIKKNTINSVVIDEKSDKIRIVVGLATCGISAGAKPVYDEFIKEIKESGLEDKVAVVQTGCIGICQYEPVAEVYSADGRTTYVKMTADKVKKIVDEHIKGGKPVTEYTIGAN